MSSLDLSIDQNSYNNTSRPRSQQENNAKLAKNVFVIILDKVVKEQDPNAIAIFKEAWNNTK